MPENEIESLELDKLDATPATSQGEESSEPIEETDDEESPSPKRPGLIKKVLGLVANKGFVLAFIVGMLLSSGGYYLFFMEKADAPGSGNAPGQITYAASAPIGFKYTVHFKLLVPFEGVDEKRILTEKLAKIRTELMAVSQEPDMGRALREKDIDSLKAKLLSIAQDVTGVSVQELEVVEVKIE